MKTLSILILAAIMGACSLLSSKNDTEPNNWSATDHYDQDFIDTLMVDMVTFIGRKPPMATSQTRFDPEFREYYVHYAREFNLIYLFVAEDGTHYYYLTRPARHTRGNRRGVGGFFTMDGHKINSFEEIFNTYVMFEEELLDMGQTLFENMLKRNEMEDVPDREEVIEWPDDRLKYDKELFEWRYIDQG